jgi:hypothetical protein
MGQHNRRRANSPASAQTNAFSRDNAQTMMFTMRKTRKTTFFSGCGMAMNFI